MKRDFYLGLAFLLLIGLTVIPATLPKSEAKNSTQIAPAENKAENKAENQNTVLCQNQGTDEISALTNQNSDSSSCLFLGCNGFF
ncbi:MAG: hypothetical protein WCV81_05305 [Microgenomates group bacterium]|jgi:hypothetical protein